MWLCLSFSLSLATPPSPHPQASSYRGTASTEEVKLHGFDMETLTDRHVVVVEDIIDSGKTADELLGAMARVKPASVHFASMLQKRTPKNNGLVADFIGVSIPDVFVVGFGMDVDESFRDLQVGLCLFDASKLQKYTS